MRLWWANLGLRLLRWINILIRWDVTLLSKIANILLRIRMPILPGIRIVNRLYWCDWCLRRVD